MGSREINYPEWVVSRENEDVFVTVFVPRSKFGPVVIRLTTDEAQQLGIALLPQDWSEQ